MNILVVGGDSVEVFRQRAARRHGQVEHWSGRKTRDLVKPIPKHTELVVLVLDRISHALARKVRLEADRRGLPLLFQRRRSGTSTPSGQPLLDAYQPSSIDHHPSI